jgi:hypothetical protein
MLLRHRTDAHENLQVAAKLEPVANYTRNLKNEIRFSGACRTSP